LSGQNATENSFDALKQLGVVVMLQGVHCPFHGLVNIRIEGMVAAEGSVECSGRLVEVGDVPVALQTVQRVGDGYFVMGFQSQAPESAAQLHLLVIHLLQSAQRWHAGPCAGKRKVKGHEEDHSLKTMYGGFDAGLVGDDVFFHAVRSLS